MTNSWVALCALLFVAYAETASAFFDPPSVSPAAPTAGQDVSVNIHGGMCDAILQEKGFPRLTVAGHAIHLVEYGLHYPENSDLCVYGIGTLTHSIGAYEPGAYTLTIDLLYRHPFLGPTLFNIGSVDFTVAGAPPVEAVPSLSYSALVSLTLLLLAVATTRRKAGMLLLIGIAISTTPDDLHAQDTQNIQVLLSTASGAPTPAQVMSWVNSSPRSATPPLAAFNVKSPLGDNWLIPDRATGDFLAWLSANTFSARYKLEQYQTITFLTADIAPALAALKADPYVAEAVGPAHNKFSSVGLTDFSVISGSPPLDEDDQYGWFDSNIDKAWQLASGYGLIAQIDMGLYEVHPALRQFTGVSPNFTYVGGNFVKVASHDIGLTGRSAQAGFDETNVDEKKPMQIPAGPCTTTGGTLPPAFVGHGTHVAGLLGANGSSGLSVQGTCKHCGIAVWKAAYLTCSTLVTPNAVAPQLNDDAVDRGKTQAVDTGAQALSLSFGIGNDDNSFNCVSYRLHPLCLTIEYSAGRDVPMIASSGNAKADLDFPASDNRVVSAGGFQQSLGLWDDAPSCPPAAPSECGSNFTKLHNGNLFTHQEVLGSAKRVLSTTYPNTTWAAYAECGDGFGTPMGDGVGWCTGTSMSAPQVAGIVGLLRSINPLVKRGIPEPGSAADLGLRTVLAQTGSRAGLWDQHLGYGIPNAADAARRMLGRVDGVPVRNRVTPLFRLWNSFAKDFADTTSPQYALSLLINQAHNYLQPSGGNGIEPAVPGYVFPSDTDDPNDRYDSYDTTALPAPRAAVYVLTTEYKPRTEFPTLVPLYLMDKVKTNGQDYILVSTTADLEYAENHGYRLRTIQGYIYQPCTPEPTCMPIGTKRFYRSCKTADDDCATFLEYETANFPLYVNRFPPSTGTKTLLGYAYPALNDAGDIADGDGDGLLDGFEYVIGTNPNASDSDLDGTADGIEFPMAGISDPDNAPDSLHDPCMGGTLGARNCGADIIFKNGFQTP